MQAFITLAVVCLIASSLASPDEYKQEVIAKTKAAFGACVKTENLSQEETMKLLTKQFSNPSENMKCAIACYLEKIDAVKDNQPDLAVITQQYNALIGPENTKVIVDKCKDIKSADRCDNAFKLYECAENIKSQFLIA